MCGVFGLGCGLNVIGGQCVVQAIHDALAGLGFELFEREFRALFSFTLPSFEAGAQCVHSSCRRRRNAAQQGQCGPPVHALFALALPFGAHHQLAGVVQHVVKQLPPGTGQLVGDFRRLAVGEHAGVLPLRNVGAAALDKVTRQVFTQVGTGADGQVFELGEVFAQQAQ